MFFQRLSLLFFVNSQLTGGLFHRFHNGSFLFIHSLYPGDLTLYHRYAKHILHVGDPAGFGDEPITLFDPILDLFVGCHFIRPVVKTRGDQTSVEPRTLIISSRQLKGPFSA